jgi:hypothetical protein
MPIDSLRTDVQVCGNLFILKPLCNELKDHSFSRGQELKGVICAESRFNL